MDEKLDKAIDLLISTFKPGAVPKPDDAQKYSQAYLNLCHAKRLLQESKHLEVESRKHPPLK